MKCIYKKTNYVDTILGKQSCFNEKRYRLLSFCVLKKCQSETLLYNNLTKKMVSLTDEEVEALNQLPSYQNQTLSPLIEEWFLVPDDNDDLKLSDQIFATATLLNQKRGITSYTILTTTDCNARCFYCYEFGVARRNMTEQTARDIADYIEKHFEGNTVGLSWFGGEPLLNNKVIDIITNSLKEKNIIFLSRMTSNGYLFNSNLIEKAIKQWNLKEVQITLDGTEKVYNRVKAYIYKDGSNPFDIVLKNINELLMNKIRVNIRLNVTQENANDLNCLIDLLAEKFAGNKHLKVYSSLLFDYDGARPDAITNKLMEEYISLEKHLYDKSLSKSSLDDFSSHFRGCMADSDSAVVIAPNGELGKCEHFSEGQNMFGSIYSDIKNTEVYNMWKKRTITEACKTCVGYPGCGGLGKCPNFTGKCDLVEKRIMRFRLEIAMQNAYNEYLEKTQ